MATLGLIAIVAFIVGKAVSGIAAWYANDAAAAAVQAERESDAARKEARAEARERRAEARERREQFLFDKRYGNP